MLFGAFSCRPERCQAVWMGLRVGLRRSVPTKLLSCCAHPASLSAGNVSRGPTEQGRHGGGRAENAARERAQDRLAPGRNDSRFELVAQGLRAAYGQEVERLVLGSSRNPLVERAFSRHALWLVDEPVSDKLVATRRDHALRARPSSASRNRHRPASSTQVARPPPHGPGGGRSAIPAEVIGDVVVHARALRPAEKGRRRSA